MATTGTGLSGLATSRAAEATVPVTTADTDRSGRDTCAGAGSSVREAAARTGDRLAGADSDRTAGGIAAATCGRLPAGATGRRARATLAATVAVVPVGVGGIRTGAGTDEATFGVEGSKRATGAAAGEGR